MASPSYTTDLVLIASAEDTTGDPQTWDELYGHALGGAETQETDYYLQGDACISQSLGGKTGTQAGLQYENGSDISGSFNDETCVFFWQALMAPNAMDTWANGGLRLVIGSAEGDFRFWKSGGSDYGRNPYGGWQNIAISHVASADYTEGTPTSGAAVFGSMPNMVAAVSKGNPHAMDVIRYGRGEIIVTNGTAADAALFSEMASVNDKQYNRWGLFQEVAGGYLWKGLMSIGTAAASVYFDDENLNVTVDDTPRTYKTFNRIEINHASSVVNWSAIQFAALSSNSPGELEIVDNAAVAFNSCTFTDMGSFAFKSNSTMTDCIFRRCNQIHQHGATFEGCTFDSTTASQAMVSANDLAEFDNSEFIYSRGHGIVISKAGTYNMTNVTFTGFGASGTSAACIYNDSGSMITINLAGGTSPTIRNGAGASTDVVVSVTLTLTGLPASTEVTIVRVSDRVVLHNTENASGSEQFGYGSAYIGTVVDILCHNLGYDPSFGSILNYTLASENRSVPIQMVPDNIYYNP